MPDLITTSTPNSSQVSEWEIMPQAMPTSSTALFSRDVHITEITVTNTTDGSLTFDISDRQAAPLELFSNTPIAARSTFGLPFKGRLMSGGVQAVASGAGLVFSLRGY
jgi:hypothetical protein